MMKAVCWPTDEERITIAKALELIIEAAEFPPTVEVYLNVEVDEFGNEKPGEGGRYRFVQGDGKSLAAQKIKESFLQFCELNQVKPRNPYSPWVADYDGKNPTFDALYEISFADFIAFAAGYDIEVQSDIAKELTARAMLPVADDVEVCSATGNDEVGLRKRERQIRVIEAIIGEVGWNPKNIPDGGKLELMRRCQEQERELFGVSTHPFDDAWKEARKQGRVRMANHSKYVK